MDFEHPCKETCSGWKQGYERGVESLAQSKLQAIYDAEINIKIEWFWDAGVDAAIGDDTNGIKDYRSFVTVKDAVDWLYDNTVGKRGCDEI